MPGHDRNQIQLIFCNVTKNTLISVTLDAQGIMPGHDRNKNQCVFCNVVLARVTLSPTGSHRLHFICVNIMNSSCSFSPNCDGGGLLTPTYGGCGCLSGQDKAWAEEAA